MAGTITCDRCMKPVPGNHFHRLPVGLIEKDVCDSCWAGLIKWFWAPSQEAVVDLAKGGT